MKVLITVKTYPIPSAKHDELVCTAGVRDDGSFVRLYQYLPLHAIPFCKLPKAVDADQTLCVVFTEELKAPFPAGPHHPIRWVVLNDEIGDSHFVVLVYHHVASDGFGVQAFLVQVLAYYLCSPGSSEGRAAVMTAKRREQISDHRRGKTQYFRPLVRSACEYSHLRSAPPSFRSRVR